MSPARRWGSSGFLAWLTVMLAMVVLSVVDGPPALAEGGGLGAAHGVARVRTLDSFAASLGVRLGGPNDQAVFDAADAAMAAAAWTGGLYVEISPGTYNFVGVRFGNNSGYFCAVPKACVLKTVRPGDSAAPTWAVSLSEPFATNFIWRGIILNGGWDWGRAPYAKTPEADPWLDHQGGVNITSAFAGAPGWPGQGYSAIGEGSPRGDVADDVVANFGGDCYSFVGAGVNTVANIQGFNCGGHGLFLNQYDSLFTGLDFGQIGRSCLWLDGAGSTNRIEGKVWYCGGRVKPGDDQGLHNANGSGNKINLIVQDTIGDAIFNSGSGNTIVANIGWQGFIAPMDPGPIAAYTCQGGANNIVTINAAIITRTQAFPNITRLYRDLTNGNQFCLHNTLVFNETGWPQDAGGWVPFWFEGPLDMSNSISLNGMQRTPQRFVEDTNGGMGFSAPLNGGSAGVFVTGLHAAYPGQTLVIAGQAGGALQGYRTSAAFATGRLSSTQNFADGDSVTIGQTVWTFQRDLTNAPGHVHLGASEAESIANLVHAINAEGGAAGRDYAVVSIPSPDVMAAVDGAHDIKVTAVLFGEGGNHIVTATTASRAGWSHATLKGGAEGQKFFNSAITWDETGDVGLPHLRGPFANDGQAAEGGTPVNGLYRDGGGVVHVRMR